MTAKEFLSTCLADLYRELETRPIAEWARENIVIDASENRQMSGSPYDVGFTPYNNVVFDFLQHHSDRELIITKSSQVGLTLAVYIGMAWLIKNAPGNLVYVARDISSVRELGKQRITPILKQISKEMEDELDERSQTIVVKRVNGATMRLVGAQSASGFISWPVSYGFIDEAEICPDLPEGSVIALTRARFKGENAYKLLVFSKAQDEPIYEVNKDTKRHKLISGQGTRCRDEFYSGTQEALHVPCPHCGFFQELVWSRMRIDDSAIISEKGVLPIEYNPKTILETTYYECISCSSRILDKHKRKMVPLGQWIPAKPEERKGPYKIPHPNRRSVHISDLYVFLFASVGWGNLMLKWLEAQGDDEKLDAFYNDHLGLPRPERKTIGKVEMSAVDRLIGHHPRIHCYDESKRWQGPRGPLTIDPLFIGIAVDKQNAYLKFIISAFLPTGEMYVLDYGTLADEEDLLYLLRNFEIMNASGEPFRIYGGLMDAGYMRSAVIDFCHAINGTIPYFAPARGHGIVAARGTCWPSSDVSVPGRIVQIVNHDGQYWENELFRYRIMDAKIDKPNRRHPRLHFPIDVDEPFKKEITNAHQIEKKVAGSNFVRPWWQKARVNEPNDYADCLKMLLVLWSIHGTDPEEPEPETEEEK